MAGSPFRFNEFELDAANFQLRRSGHAVQLQKIPLELLLLLVERNGQLVTREEIVERIWGKDVFLDTESAVATAIRKLRNALGDNPAEPTYIKTVPAKGYRFTSLSELPPAPHIERIPVRPTIAVLPIEDLSDEIEDYFSDGITEEVLTYLSRLQVGVIARTSVMPYKSTRKSVRQIGYELGAGYVLEGSVRRNSGKIRITVQLIETKNQTHLWAETYEHGLDDVFRLQDRIAHEIARQISLQLKIDSPAYTPSGHNISKDAYEAYLKGRYFWNKRSAPGAMKGIEYFHEAIRLEPSFAPALAGLADVFIFQGIHGIRPPADAFPRAEEMALKALALDSSLADALCSLASIQDLYHWKWTTAEPLFRRAIQLNPGYPVARFFFAGVLSEVGQFDEALQQIGIAREIDPLSAFTLGFSGYISYRARRYQSAEDQLDQALEMDAGLPTVHWYRGLVLEQEQEFNKAIEAHTEAARLSMEQPLFVAALGHACGRAGRRQEALSALQKLMHLTTLRYVSPLEIAVVHIGLDDTDAAFDWLQKAYEQRVTRMRALRDPLFDGLRTDPRFTDLLERVGLPQ